MTALAELRSCYDALRRDPTATKAQRVQAFERWHNQACVEGRPPFALDRHITDEATRFWSQVAEGTSGHRYWIGAKRGFIQNDGRYRRPRRWVWEQDHGPIAITTDVWVTCGEGNCIAPGHLAGGRSERRYWISTDAILGGLQVAAMRLGHAPASKWWDTNGGRPYSSMITQRFGSWAKAVRAAGLEPWRTPVGGSEPRFTREQAITGLRELAVHLGHTPSSHEWIANRDWLSEHGYPRTPSTLAERLGVKTWAEIIREADLK